MIAPYITTSLVEVFKKDNKSQLRLRKDNNSTKMNNFLIHGTIPVTIFSNMITLEIVISLLDWKEIF